MRIVIAQALARETLPGAPNTWFETDSSGVRGHEKVPTGGQVAVPAGGHAGSPVVAM